MRHSTGAFTIMHWLYCNTHMLILLGRPLFTSACMHYFIKIHLFCYRLSWLYSFKCIRFEFFFTFTIRFIYETCWKTSSHESRGRIEELYIYIYILIYVSSLILIKWIVPPIAIYHWALGYSREWHCDCACRFWKIPSESTTEFTRSRAHFRRVAVQFHDLETLRTSRIDQCVSVTGCLRIHLVHVQAAVLAAARVIMRGNNVRP